MTNIHIEIERLILDGLPLDGRQSRIVQSAIEAELARQFSHPEANAGGLDSSVAYTATDQVNWNAASGPISLGHEVGNAVSRSIQR